MPADARLLLRAAVASSSAQALSESGVKDRFASYHPKTRALRCTACDYLTIKHESLWASHAASKSHRNNVANIRREEGEKERQREIALKKERAALADKEEVGETGTGGKRKEQERGRDEESSKRAKKSDPDQQSIPVDAEWQRFQREVLDAAPVVEQPPLVNYAGATIEVKPELNSGFGENMDGDDEEDEEEQPAQKVVETDAERRARLDREDREEILARLEEEQRVQDEADERVSALKSRFEKLKQARAAKKR